MVVVVVARVVVAAARGFHPARLKNLRGCFDFSILIRTGHWIATGQVWGKFLQESVTKNLEIKGPPYL